MTETQYSSPEHRPQQVAVEPDVIPSGKMFVLLALLALVIVGSCVALWQFFRVGTQHEVSSKVHANQAQGVLEVRAKARSELSSYGVIDAKKGIYRIPIKRAMAMLVANPRLLDPQPPPPKAAPPPKKVAPPPPKAAPPPKKLAPPAQPPAARPATPGAPAKKPAPALQPAPAKKTAPQPAPAKKPAPQPAPAKKPAPAAKSNPMKPSSSSKGGRSR